MSKSRRQAGQEFCSRAPAFLFQQYLLLQPKGAEGRHKSERKRRIVEQIMEEGKQKAVVQEWEKQILQLWAY